MNSSRDRYTVNLFKPNKGYMREEVRIIILIFCGWLLVTFGFQFLTKMWRDATNGFGLMPANRWPIPPQDRWAIIAWVREMQKKRLAAAEGTPPAGN